MERIFVTGDVHNNVNIGKFSTGRFPVQEELTREDIVFVCGDFGLPWGNPADQIDRYLIDWLGKKNFTIVFVDGNHENFDALKTYPEVVYKGALCHKISDNIYHLERGEVMAAAGHKILGFGGALSIDKGLREEGISWWPEEMPAAAEYEKCLEALSTEKPDILLTHEGPFDLLYSNFCIYEGNCLSRWLQLARLDFEEAGVKQWYFGHHHKDQILELEPIRIECLFETIKEIE